MPLVECEVFSPRRVGLWEAGRRGSMSWPTPGSSTSTRYVAPTCLIQSLLTAHSQSGTRIGKIALLGAQIGSQRAQSTTDDSYRHAFLIRTREKGESVDHILCAESDSERDAWVESLTCHISGSPDATAATLAAEPADAPRATKHQPDQATRDPMGRLSPDGSSPMMDASPVARLAATPGGKPEPSPRQASLGNERDHAQSPEAPTGRPIISGPMNGAPITGKVKMPMPEEKRAKFRSAFWGFGSKPSSGESETAFPTFPVADPVLSKGTHGGSGAVHPLLAPAPRPIFGVSLQEAVSVAKVRDDLELPAIVFRTIEFVESRQGLQEEGLYRLSGSSAVIKGLKDRFNVEGDVNLLETKEHLDVHAVTGLLKLFLRELATPIIPHALQQEFVNAAGARSISRCRTASSLRDPDLPQRSDRATALGRICTRLPLPNYTLLRFLSAHLIHVVENESINRMTVRNISIVFSPTLAMPVALFSLFLTEFDGVFEAEEGEQGTSQSDKRKSRNSILYPARFLEAGPRGELLTTSSVARR